MDLLDLTPLWTTLKLASTTTLILLLIGTPLAWWLARSKTLFIAPVEAIIALPLILPPTVLGFYLLISLGPNGPIGSIVSALGGSDLIFSFTGLVIGSCIYSMPFVVQPLQNVFNNIDQRLLDTASTLGASNIDRFISVVLPLSKNGFLTASVLGFAHTVGEFGVVLMIGGNIPGKTQVLSIAIYDHVEAMEYHQAHLWSGGLLLASFCMLIGIYSYNRLVTQRKNN